MIFGGYTLKQWPIILCSHQPHPGGPMTRSKIIKHKGSQMVRQPEQVAFPDDVHQVEIIGTSGLRP